MPSSSLWLLPPETHSLRQDLQSLIQQTAAHFGSEDLFVPHVTITSGILPLTYSPDPQAWLDSLHLPAAHQVQVLFDRLDSEDVFFRKLYIKCAKTTGLKQLVKVCRRQVPGYTQEAEAAEWVQRMYNPHTSLLYHDCPRINDQGMLHINQLVQRAGVSLGNGPNDSWIGGVVVLVETDKPVDKWVPIAKRTL